MLFLRRISGYKITGHLCAILYKFGHLREESWTGNQVALSHLTNGLSETGPKTIANQTKEEVLDIRVDDGRAVLETERANENLL
jgi:hypothetical protein